MGGANSTIPIAEVNREQLRAWDGDEGAYWAANADDFDRSVAEHHRYLLEAAAVTPTDRVLDVGCGTGQTTRDAARQASSGSALGIDLSSAMLELARRRASTEGLTNATFVQADAQIHTFPPAEFDLVLSRTGAMFFADAAAAFRNLAGATAPGGRLAMLVWQGPAGNEWLREFSTALSAGRERPAPPLDAPGPFSLSDPDRVRPLLTEAGFRDVSFDGIEPPMWFGDDASGSHRFVLGLLGWMLEGLDDVSAARAREDLSATLAAHASSDGVRFRSAAWIITATRDSSTPIRV